MKPYTLTNREGESISPMTSTKTVFDANGTDLETLLNEQQQAIDDGLGACAKKTEVAQGLAAKQDALSDSADITVSADNELSLTEKAKYATFDAQWTAAGGTVIESGKTYGCNGLTDITYEQALYIYRHTAQGGRFGQTSWNHLSFRTNLPIQGFGNTNAANEAFRECTSVETINLPTTYGKHCRLSSISRMFQQCVKLEAIIGAPIFVWNVAGNSNVNNAFYMCHKLKEVRIVWNCNYNISFSDSPLLSYDTIEYFITNATNTAAITITLHPDAYARVTEEIFALAAEKNITIATT